MRDLRQYLAQLEKAGELNTVDLEVDWNLQAAAVSGMSNRVGGPAVHFRNVKGYSNSCSLAGSLFSGPALLNPTRGERSPWRRIAVALGLDAGIDYETLMSTCLTRRKAPLKSLQVSGGPCKEVVVTGEEVDLFRFPWPMLHKDDGGRYSTCHSVIVKDVDTPWQNWGAYPLMVAAKDRMVCHFQPTRHSGFDFAAIYGKYASRGQAMPVCVAFGGEPVNMLTSNSTFIPLGQDEAAVAGGLQLAPVELTKAETCDIQIPAHAEIIIEGEITPGDKAEGGPFPSDIAYTPKQPGLALRVKAITHRKDPILPFIAEGARVSDSVAIRSITSSMELWAFMRLRHLALRWLYLPVESLLGLCVVSAAQAHPGSYFYLTQALWSHPLGHLFDKILVVDPELEGADIDAAFTDWFNRANPMTGWHFSPNDAPLGPVAAYATEKDLEEKLTTRVWIDATTPTTWVAAERPKRVSFEESFPLEIQERAVRRWKEDFDLPGEPIWKRRKPAQA